MILTTTHTKRIILTLPVLFLFISSCKTLYIYQKERLRQLGFYADTTKTAVVICNNNVLVAHCTDGFEKQFKSGRSFTDSFTTLFMKTLHEKHVFAKAEFNPSLGLDSVDPFKPEPLNISESVLSGINADYLVCLYAFEVTSQSGYTAYGWSSGNMKGFSTEDCMVKARLQVYDVKTRQKIQDVWAWGYGEIFLGIEVPAHKAAFAKCAQHAVEYLKTEQLEFKD